ncbi:MAG: aldehyde dehydrogenase family protein [Puia sp.]|nr:aldehyde dehydrogenase family protein [Puia sp.]
MLEEIFGPILPIIHYKNLDEAIEYVNKGSKPLALYIFSEDKKAIESIISQTSSGGVTVNEAMLRVFDPTIPFGGINAVGWGLIMVSMALKSLAIRKAFTMQVKGHWTKHSIRRLQRKKLN